MLIKALCDYYDVLERNGKTLPEGYSFVDISYLISLTPDGKIDDIIDWRKEEEEIQKNGKTSVKKVARCEFFPRHERVTSIVPYILDYRPLFIFGLDYDNKEYIETSKAKKSHKLCTEKNLDFIEGLDSPVINAYRNFLRTWNPSEERNNPFLDAIKKNYKKNYSFCLSGVPEIPIHKDLEFKKRWEEKNRISSENNEDKKTGQCAIYGDNRLIARKHDAIKGIVSDDPKRKEFVLISCNNASECSYGKEQSYNSNVSEIAMRKYTESLNYLISSGNRHKTMLDDINVVYWAVDGNAKADDLISSLLFGNTEKINADEMDDILKSLMEGAREGNITNARLPDSTLLNEDTDYYIVGFKPNASRLSVKFIYKKRFGDILLNIARHQSDLQIDEEAKTIQIWQIGRELVSPNSSKEKVNPIIYEKLIRAILYDTPYPAFLLENVVRRIKTDIGTDHDGKRIISLNSERIRVSIVKAYLNRKSRLKYGKEEIKLGLDKENTSSAYLCGRLFAVMEKVQQEAAGNNLNRTIKDAYFSSAASKPAFIFPKILKVTQYHLRSLESKGREVYYTKMMQEIIDKMGDSFPDTLLLPDQGRFIIGYYQQYQSFFAGREKED